MHNNLKKEIRALLTKNSENEIVIRFYFEDIEKDLNLQSNNSEEIKKVFLELSKQLRLNPLEIKLEIDKKIDEKNDGLFIETSLEYINQLNDEMLILENDDDLKTIRDFIYNKDGGKENDEK